MATPAPLSARLKPVVSVLETVAAIITAVLAFVIHLKAGTIDAAGVTAALHALNHD